MQRFSLFCGPVLILFAAQAADACTSIRIKTTDSLVFYARTMEGGAKDLKTVSLDTTPDYPNITATIK